MINYLVLKQDEVEENHVDDCFRSPEKSADFRSEKSADFRFDQKLKNSSKRPRRTKRQQQIDTQHQDTQEVEPNLSQQTGTVHTLVYRIDVQYEINVQVGKFLKNIKRVGQNRRAGGKNFWKINKRAGGKFILLNKIVSSF